LSDPKTFRQRLVRLDDHFGNVVMIDPRRIVSFTPYRDAPDITCVGTKEGTYVILSGSTDQVADQIEDLASGLEAA
jgi:hypothetical protein